MTRRPTTGRPDGRLGDDPAEPAYPAEPAHRTDPADGAEPSDGTEPSDGAQAADGPRPADRVCTGDEACPNAGGRTPLHVPRPERAHAERIAAVRQARLTAAPAHLPSEHEQAAFELGLVVALVLGAPDASRGLDLLVNARRIQPEGAEVFAALLYATGREEGAEFWWRFAAGSGSGTAAYCLHLHHLMLGETDDADYWRAWSDQLARTERPPGPGALRMSRPLLPDDVRRDILSRVHRGLAPQLPPRLVAVIDRLPVRGDPDEEEVPSPWGLTSGATSACSWQLGWEGVDDPLE